MIHEAREVCAVRGAHEAFGVRKVRGAAFDIDGTLLDSTGIWDGLAGRYLSSIGVRAGPDRSRSEERRVGKECRSRWSPYH